MIFVNPRST
ncbi:hypothetical protein CP8484711_2118A, partial [Chlamydia psittaci 84-8471/1]